MNDNIVSLRKDDTAQQVLESALSQRLEHVIVIGITELGDNYFQATGRSTMLEVVWMAFCANETVQRMLKDRP